MKHFIKPLKTYQVQNIKAPQLSIKTVGFIALASRRIGQIGTKVYHTAKQAKNRLNQHFNKVAAFKAKKAEQIKNILSVINDRRFKTIHVYNKVGKCFNFVVEMCRLSLLAKLAKVYNVNSIKY